MRYQPFSHVQVKELNAQLDGDGGGGAAAGAGYDGYDSYAEDDAHEVYEQQQAYRRYDAARAVAGQGAETPHGQPVAPQQQQPGYSPEVEQCVRQSVAELEAKLEGVLEGVADDLAAEVSREQQHLVLMQSQVDKQVGGPRNWYTLRVHAREGVSLAMAVLPCCCVSHARALAPLWTV